MSNDHRDSLELPEQEGSSSAQDDLTAWLAWVRQLAALGSALSVLATAELRLASGDLRRLLLLTLLLFPLVMFAWLGLSVFFSWLAYSQSGMPGVGFFAFFVIQLCALLYMRLLYKKYRRGLTMPMTRKYLAEIAQDIKHGP